MRPVIILIILPLLFTLTHSWDQQNPRFRVMTKRQNNDNLEQCASVDFIVKQLGVVNVVAFLETSWPFSYRQASMLKELKDRLERSNLPETLFFVIINGGSSPWESEDDAEEAAWQGVAPEEASELSTTVDTQKSLEDMISPDIFVIQDNEELGLWSKLKGSRDQILVLDRCGKLTYQVIIPWSILHFPYVKAAILSTHNDNPCGYCDNYPPIVQLDQVQDQPIGGDPQDMITKLGIDWKKIENVDFDTTTPSIEEIQELSSSTDPELPELRIIMHAPHYHTNDDAKKLHEYLMLVYNKPDYHGHLDLPQEVAKIPKKPAQTIVDSIAFGEDESPGLYGEVADFWRELNVDEDSQTTENYPTTVDQTENPVDWSTATGEESVTGFTVEEEESRSKLIAHYSRLLPWIYYVLNK